MSDTATNDAATTEADAPPPKTTLSITIDDRPIEANPGELVIAAAQRNGTYIPRFCYHERMAPVGMCRQCIVDIDTGRGPALSVSCMVPVAEGMVVSTQSERVKKAQEGVLEFLLINHPLDCPVCDKGGECPLQDHTVSHGPGESRFVEEKRHYEKPIAISALVDLDRERCILCDRCTRFARDVAGDPLISFVERGNATQVLTFPDEPFASYFSGNTVQICPVGALTSRAYRFKARPWDLTQVESTCTNCSVGCRITLQSSRNQLLRKQGVDSDPVNWSWLCDRGRYDFEAVNSEARLRAPMVRSGGELVEASWAQALDAAAFAIEQAIDQHGPSSVAVLGGARGTNEDAYTWVKLAKGIIGTDSVDAQLGDGLPPEALYGLPAATIDEVCASPTIVLLGPDIKEELPVLYLRLRDAAERRVARIIELSPRTTGLTPYAWLSLRYRPGEQAALVRALVGGAEFGDVATDVAAAVRDQLGRGAVGVVLGRANLAETAAFTVDAAAALHAGVPSARFLRGPRRANAVGALDAGMAPGLAPGRRPLDADVPGWAQRPAGLGLDAEGILRAAADGRVACLVLLGADPVQDFPDRDLARRGLAGAGAVVAVDTFLTESNRSADVVLAAASYAEKSGTTTNIEGRVTALGQAVTPIGSARPDWILAADLAFRLGADLGIESSEDALAEMAKVSPSHAAITGDELRTRRDGIVAEPGSVAFVAPEPTTAPPVSGYHLRLVTSRVMYDGATLTSHAEHLAPLAPGARAHLNPYDFGRLGIAPAVEVRLNNGVRSLVLEAQPDAGVLRGTVWVAFNQPGTPVNELIDAASVVTDLTVDTL